MRKRPRHTLLQALPPKILHLSLIIILTIRPSLLQKLRAGRGARFEGLYVFLFGFLGDGFGFGALGLVAAAVWTQGVAACQVEHAAAFVEGVADFAGAVGVGALLDAGDGGSVSQWSS